ncbi:hypothetical protein MTO96_036193 [Rhipicephalus appendiculatus]
MNRRRTPGSDRARAATRPPDLSIWSDAGAIAWSNSFEDLGSDHRILCVTVGEDESEMGGCRKARIVDWDKFRENREREKQESPIEDIGECTRTATRVQMAKLPHKYKDDPEAFAEEIVQTHLTRPAGQSHLEYRGAPNEELDADFSVQEIRAVLQLLKTKSAPGPDKITNQILRNLNDDAIEKLLTKSFLMSGRVMFLSKFLIQVP